jgi:cytochrome P450
MNAHVVPVRLNHPAAPLPRLQMLRSLVRNPLEAWPEGIFHERIATQRLFGRQTVTVLDPELIRAVLVDEADAFWKGDILARTLGPALGQGILTADGAHWRWQRRAAAPNFRNERIVGFVPAMLEAAEATAAEWRALPPGSRIDVAEAMMRTTFDIIVATMLSGPNDIDVKAVGASITEYLEPVGWQLVLALLNAPHWLPYPGSRKARLSRRYLRTELTRVLAERRASGEDRNDLISLLFAARDSDSGRQMTDGELADNLLTFVSAGHETTALALTWTLYLLSQAPDVESHVRAEVEQVTGGGPLTVEALNGLVYTRQAIQEAMRLYPPAPLIARQAVRPVRIGPVDLEKDARVQIPIYVVHRHRALWDEPDAFDPDRFAPDAAKERHRYAYLPFGAGPRICIGASFAMLEAAAVLATLVRQTRLTAEPGHVPYPVLRITLRPQGGMPMRVFPLS